MFREGNIDQSPSQTPRSQTEAPKKVFTQEELRDRYEKSYRDGRAESFKAQRVALREAADKEKAANLKRMLDGEGSARYNEKYEIEKIDKEIRFIDDTHLKEASLRLVQSQKNSRSLFKKLWHKVAKDPLSEQEAAIQNQIGITKEKILAKETQKLKVKEVLASKLEKIKTEIGIDQARATSAATGERKDLLERIRSVNSASRRAIEKTLEQVNNGDLDISKLAEEANAIVVHSIPLEGWSMMNTSMNNQVVNVTELTPEQKIATIKEKQPDLSASIITAGRKIPGQATMYPFGLIVDGKVIASHEKDSSSIAIGDRRFLKYGQQTLRENQPDSFAKIAKQRTPDHDPWNESIVHQPKIKAIFLDEEALARSDRGDEVTEFFAPTEEAEIIKKYGDRISSTAKGIPTSGQHAGKEVFRIKRKRTGMEKALDYANSNYKELPVYIQKNDGIYTPEGIKVDAKTIYQ